MSDLDLVLEELTETQKDIGAIIAELKLTGNLCGLLWVSLALRELVNIAPLEAWEETK